MTMCAPVCTLLIIQNWSHPGKPCRCHWCRLSWRVENAFPYSQTTPCMSRSRTHNLRYRRQNRPIYACPTPWDNHHNQANTASKRKMNRMIWQHRIIRYTLLSQPSRVYETLVLQARYVFYIIFCFFVMTKTQSIAW